MKEFINKYAPFIEMLDAINTINYGHPDKFKGGLPNNLYEFINYFRDIVDSNSIRSNSYDAFFSILRNHDAFKADDYDEDKIDIYKKSFNHWVRFPYDIQNQDTNAIGARDALDITIASLGEEAISKDRYYNTLLDLFLKELDVSIERGESYGKDRIHVIQKLTEVIIEVIECNSEQSSKLISNITDKINCKEGLNDKVKDIVNQFNNIKILH